MLWLEQQLRSLQIILVRNQCWEYFNCIFIVYYSFLIVFNGIFRFINSRFFIKILHIKRIIANVIAMVLGYSLISISCLLSNTNISSFIISLFASVIHGLTSCFGESVILGYLKGFPAELVVGWSSGTGFAGVVGAGIVVVLLALEFQLFAVFIIV